MNEIEHKKIVQHNDLITSVAKMDKTPLKIFELAVSCIDTENPPKDNVIYLSKNELFNFFDVKSESKHSRFKQAIEVMQKQAFFEIKQEKNKGYKYRSIVPIPTVEWTDNGNDVFIRFNPDIMPYLIDLKKNFTQYALTDIMELNSKYSIILYKWLSMNYNQYEHYSKKGNRRQEQLNEYKNPRIKLAELRKMTNTVKEYSLFTNFSKFVLDKPLDEITKYTHFNVTYDKIKKGRSIDSIQFHITKKKVAKNEFYKQEQQDEVYLQTKEQREQQRKILSAEAMQNPYTMLLVENTLLIAQEMTNIDLMAELQESVYPLYKELETKRGLNGLKKHLLYIKKHQEGYSKQNLAKYLKTAINGYISAVELQDSFYPDKSAVNNLTKDI